MSESIYQMALKLLLITVLHEVLRLRFYVIWAAFTKSVNNKLLLI